MTPASHRKARPSDQPHPGDAKPSSVSATPHPLQTPPRSRPIPGAAPANPSPSPGVAFLKRAVDATEDREEALGLHCPLCGKGIESGEAIRDHLSQVSSLSLVSSLTRRGLSVCSRQSSAAFRTEIVETCFPPTLSHTLPLHFWDPSQRGASAQSSCQRTKNPRRGSHSFGGTTSIPPFPLPHFPSLTLLSSCPLSLVSTESHSPANHSSPPRPQDAPRLSPD
jgi:hypothetical protein